MDKLVTGARENPIFPDFLAGDRLLMMVHGEVVAGIDFSNLKLGDVKVDGKKIHLHLPASQVFRTRIDSAKTRVYSRQTGLLVPTDPNLETQVRQAAERQLQEAALADGILQTAQQNAASTISSLLPVSYTHLDVYKRQVHHVPRWLHRMAAVFWACSGGRAPEILRVGHRLRFLPLLVLLVRQ